MGKDKELFGMSRDEFYEYVAKGGNLDYFGDTFFTKAERREVEKYIGKVPQEYVNRRVENGGYLLFLTESQKKAIPQELINKRVAEGGNIDGIPLKRLKAVPKECFERRKVNKKNKKNESINKKNEEEIAQMGM